MRLGWLRKIDWQGSLEGDYAEIAELIGIENFIKLAESYFKLTVSFSSVQFEKLAKDYITQNDELSVRQLARETGTSERFVQKIKRRQKGRKELSSSFN